MKDHIVKVMKLVDRNYLNKNERKHYFGSKRDVEFRWEKNKNPNEANYWFFRFKGEKTKFFFNQLNVIQALKEFEINHAIFLSYLENMLLNESIVLQMGLEDLEKNLGKDRVKEAKIACDKFLLEVRKQVNTEMKKTYSSKIPNFSKTIKITDSE